MKFMHISDLHIGKRIHNCTLLEDQKYILKKITEIAAEQQIDALLISGDIYDKSVPSVEAVDIFDNFITEISDEKIVVFAISGNHDSPERLDYGSRIMKKHRVHIAGDYKGNIPVVTLTDDYGKINIYSLPYLKPGTVNKRLGVQTKTFEECVKTALDAVDISEAERNVILAHQFITAGGAEPERSDSETKSLGGTDNVDVSIFDKFDYVALGHIHRPQRIGRELVRYSGSPLKYSFSECAHHKSAVIVDMKEKGTISYELIPLKPLREMKEIRGTLEELKSGQYDKQVLEDAYVHITLTDENEMIDAIGKVRTIYPNVLVLDFDNERRKKNTNKTVLSGNDLKEKTPLELFESFFAMQHNNTALTERQTEVFREITDEIKGGQA